MSGIGFSEFLILCMIGLIVLGPKRLPQVASQIGSWIGQARRMTRVMKRQLEDELNFDKELNIGPTVSSSAPSSHPPPRDDDTYSPLHGDDDAPADRGSIDLDTDGSVDDERDEFDVEPDFGPAADEPASARTTEPGNKAGDDDDEERRQA